MPPSPIVEIPFDVERVNGRNLRLYAWAMMEFKHPKTRKMLKYKIKFQIDTGADSTTVFNRDMRRLEEIGLSYEHVPELPPNEWSAGVLGERLPTYVVEDVTLTFSAVDGKAHSENLQKLRIVDIPQRENNDPYQCHALLGMVVLERFVVVFDGPSASASMMLPISPS